ncbi:MAG TPA: hypothetical protein PK175_10810 [Syntrophales bacterium]|jgi:hypothetical protein|nr:hypothetical protein [Syntrophales bacterium]HON23765.1 hypothetical protein [Syntrophales bacterium]HOU78269.1 hypothetical protein [Syntrophales bacterium]HPC33198.1 hypothetical protein [Syntrophales bacterium]HQG35354.1 hypothetical protein [Syntrophales bacterium]
MARRNQNSFFKRQREIKRMQEAQEKMARRQGKRKREQAEEEARSDLTERPVEAAVAEEGQP